jgi:hypothetical protein
LKINVLTNGLPAKKIQNVSLPSMIAKKNAEPKLLAGIYVYQAKAARLLSMLQNALKPTGVTRLHHKSN